ncbi:MAG: hypothetical protein HKN79_03930 [Flavobacteriales bacterium]|nr:hypothetical protein [Flavobacteriales bacterium]
MTEVWYSIGDFITWTFGILEALGNIPNVIFTIIGFIGAGFWLMRQAKYTKEDGQAGRLI